MTSLDRINLNVAATLLREKEQHELADSLEAVNRSLQSVAADASSAKRRIASSLSLLENPTPGMVVEGEGCSWTRAEFVGGLGYWKLTDDTAGGCFYDYQITPTLCALVKAGAATVRLPQQEEGK